MMAPWVSALEVLSFTLFQNKNDNALEDRKFDHYPGCSILHNLLSGRPRHRKVLSLSLGFL